MTVMVDTTWEREQALGLLGGKVGQLGGVEIQKTQKRAVDGSLELTSLYLDGSAAGKTSVAEEFAMCKDAYDSVSTVANFTDKEDLSWAETKTEWEQQPILEIYDLQNDMASYWRIADGLAGWAESRAH